MKGTLHKTEQEWVVRYKVPAYTKANEQTFFDRELILHPDEPHIVDNTWDGKDVEFEEVEFVCEQRGDNVWVRYGAKNINQLSQEEKSLSDKWKEYQDWLNELPEISDEEIEKAARDYDNSVIYGPPLLHFEQGAFWYREQLKNKKD